MKKLLCSVLAAAAILCGMFALGACAKPDDSASAGHNWSEWHVVKDATCTEDGLSQRECLDEGCSETETKIIEKTGHTPVLEEGKPATCGEAGYTERSVCSVCGVPLSEREILPALGHEYGEWTSDGEGNHVRVCKNDGTHIEKAACKYVVETVEASCETMGYTVKRCETCNDSHIENETPALGHDYEDSPWLQTEGGDFHYRVCKNNPEHTERASCDYTAKTVLPGCETEGYTTYTCNVCRFEKTPDLERVPANGHSFGPWTTVEGEDYHESVCSACSDVKREECAFDVSTAEATCTVPGSATYVCRGCGRTRHEVGAVLGHDWGDGYSYVGNGMHSRSCARCGETQTNACADFIEYVLKATCLEDGYTELTCEDCKNVTRTNTESALGHDYEHSEWQQVTGSEAHIRHCARPDCNATDTAPCVFTFHTTAATCTNPGNTERRCNTCGASSIISETEPLGHVWGEWNYIGEDQHRHVCTRPDCDGVDASETMPCRIVKVNETPTCKNPVDIFELCEDCHHTEDVGDIAALEHTWGAWTPDGDHLGHTRTCSVCEQEQKEVCPYTLTTINSTCLQAGSTTYTCPTCEDSYTVVLNDGKGLGHDWGPYLPDGIYHRTHTRTCLRDGCGESEQKICGYIDDVIEPTCETPGYATHYCPDCHDTYRDSEKPALNHSWGPVQTNGNGTHYQVCDHDKTHIYTQNCAYGAATTKQPTCTEQGYRTRVCTACSYVKTDNYTDALGHSYGAWSAETANTHTHSCTVCGNRETLKCNFVGEATPATCLTGGYTVYQCRDCSNNYRAEETPKLGHSWGYWIYDSATQTHTRTCKRDSSHTESGACDFVAGQTVAPTCTAAGFTVYSCSVCTAMQFRDQVEAKEHDWTDYVYSKATGTHSRRCGACNAYETNRCVFTESVRQATCTEQGYTRISCEICRGVRSETVIPAFGHDFTDWKYVGTAENHVNERICQRENCRLREEQACNFVPAGEVPTCEKGGTLDMVCKDCHYSLVLGNSEALGHNWGEGYVQTKDETHTRICVRCGKTEVEQCKIEVTYQGVTCVTPGVETRHCSACGRNTVVTVEASPLRHSWSEWTANDDGATHTRTCLRETCGATETAKHDYSECNLCPCGVDGLHYVLAPGEAAYLVDNDNGVLNAKSIVIPSLHLGLPVIGFSKYAFSQNKSVESVELPLSILTIEDDAFFSCPNLRRVFFTEDPERKPAVTSIGYMTFAHCNSLTEIMIPDSVSKIGEMCFYSCASLMKIDVPDDVTEIGSRAFYGSGLFNNPENWTEKHALYLGKHLIRVWTDVSGTYSVLENTLSISAYAFGNCTQITRVDLPASVKAIDMYAFLNCTALQHVEYAGMIKDWFSIDFENDYSSPMVYASSLHIGGATADGVIPEGATSIPAGTFRGTSLTSITIPSTVRRIGDNAFNGCTQLESVIFSDEDNVVYIGENAFADTKFINNSDNYDEYGVLYVNGKHVVKAKTDVSSDVVLKPETVTIAPAAFDGCAALASVSIPGTVRQIGKYAFRGTSLKSATFGEFSGYFMAWSLTESGDNFLGRSVNYNDVQSPAAAATLLTKTYPGEWRR